MAVCCDLDGGSECWYHFVEDPQLQPPPSHQTHLHEQVLSSSAILLEVVGQKVLEGVVMLSFEVEL